jgi:hypothetical protein
MQKKDVFCEDIIKIANDGLLTQFIIPYDLYEIYKTNKLKFKKCKSISGRDFYCVYLYLDDEMLNLYGSYYELSISGNYLIINRKINNNIIISQCALLSPTTKIFSYGFDEKYNNRFSYQNSKDPTPIYVDWAVLGNCKLTIEGSTFIFSQDFKTLMQIS